ncbi:hypothetical protein PAPYR_5943 [Paratrimastix pyriformis]|uniref:Uncharacterized protein n=1 Tax=Paratrimastix pyriformis TaxID=342808 RepID=A0ABQ8UKA5_9EUKA|nr:hypothetical protein PAPYR_5943 [Paratrimastix pyriformis]
MTITNIAEFLVHLPLDLLLSVVEISDCPTTTYIQFLGLTHTIRSTILGTAREMCFVFPENDDDYDDDYDYDDEEEKDENDADDADEFMTPLPAIPGDALAALLRPCKRLSKFSLVGQMTPLLDSGNEFECAAWVMQAFGGHSPTALESLRAPVGLLVLALLRGGDLRGLEELHLESGNCPVLGRILAALGRGACPGLRVLEISGFNPGFKANWAAVLRPMASTLRELIIPEVWRPARLEGFLASPRCALERVSLVTACNMGPLTPRNLTHLALHREGDLTGLDLCRLESLDVPVKCPGLAAVLSANQPTLRALTLRGWTGYVMCLPAPVGHAWPRVIGNPEWVLAPALLDRLEQLCLYGLGASIPRSVAITSTRLRVIHLEEMDLGGPNTLNLLCPRLEDLNLPRTFGSQPYGLVIDCPRLRCIRYPGPWSMPPSIVGWMARVVRPILAGTPGLTGISGVLFDRPETLLQFESLRRLALPIQKKPASGSLVLRLPPQLERFEATLLSVASAVEIEGPGLCAASIQGVRYEQSVPTVVSLRCPKLATLSLAGDIGTFNLDACPPLTGLYLVSCRRMKEDSLVACLTRHGACLRHVAIRVGPMGWSQRVALALERLPRLAQLTLGENGPNLVLACPRLRQLTVSPMPRSVPLSSLVLNCPLLEDLQVPFAALRRLDLVGPPRGLSRIGGVGTRLLEMKPRFPGVYLDPVGIRGLRKFT